MTPLDRKLLRDLWRIKSQAMAIALVMAVGVLLLIMMDGMLNSIVQTRQAYYDRYRLADVFAPVVRAPNRVLDSIAKVEGVASVEGRIIGGALVDLEHTAVPIRAQTVSLPENRVARLNELYLAEGRRPDPSRPEEIILLQGFANAHDLEPGDALSVTLKGARHKFRVVGLAQAPEFLYTTAPGELFPDDARFAVIWISERALEAAYDLDGAFNQVLIGMDRGGVEASVIDKLDQMLTPYGATGAYALSDHFSNVFISEEITQLGVTSRTVPPVFMAVAAFLLYIVTSRMIHAERMQIGLLKAFGYTSLEISVHYLKLFLTIAVIGAVLGCALGVWSGQAMAEYFQKYYKFPFLIFSVDPASFILALTVSIATASAGSLVVLRQIFALTPAVAMRPPAPTDYSTSANIVGLLRNLLDQPSRMVLRRLLRHPMRVGAAIIGIAAGMGLTVAQMGVMEGFERTVELGFSVVDRSDATVSFVEPLGRKTLFELKQMDGVFQVEPFRTVPALLRNGHRTHRGAIIGLQTSPVLNRAISSDQTSVDIRSDGVILSQQLADKLELNSGDQLIVEIREGIRPTLTLPVVGVFEAMVGSPAYLEFSALNKAMDQSERVSGAYLTVDQHKAETLFRNLKDMPAIAGVSLRKETRDAVVKLMNSGAGATRYIMSFIAGIIAFGIVYNSARIAFSERSHDLASMRVMGFTRGETAYVLLGELAVMTLLALPIGTFIGVQLAGAIAAGFSNDLYTIPSDIGPTSIGAATLAIVGSSIFSGLLVKRDIDKLDLVSALKSRE